ncbi:MAG TPA: peptidylprolyl isomerase [Burkholderiales bacterium]|nr:peptidylprolyl isomerase [Pseudomonadota bacterium]HVC48761.1 peptidylprolyl isomerase [Burkholderiales bacterium]
MDISRDSVVSLTYCVRDEKGKVVDETLEPISYLHGGYDGIFPMIEEALQGKGVGTTLSINLTAEDAFGQYDDTLVRTEARNVFPTELLELGMQFEGSPEGSDDFLVYTVTGLTDSEVVVDGNHPLAGMALQFSCTVTDVRPATAEEIQHGHVHGAHGHIH